MLDLDRKIKVLIGSRRSPWTYFCYLYDCYAFLNGTSSSTRGGFWLLPVTFPLLGSDYVVSVSLTHFHITEGIFALAMVHSVAYHEFNECRNHRNCFILRNFSPMFPSCFHTWEIIKSRSVVSFTSSVRSEHTPLFSLPTLGAISVNSRLFASCSINRIF